MVQQPRPDRVSQRRMLKLGIGSGTIAVLLVGPVSLAQQSTDLPPPPSVSSAPSSNPGLPSASPLPEQVFQAPEPFPVPQSAPIPHPSRRYTVVVNGDSPYLMTLVQAVEPKAGLQKISGRQMIQAGVFETEAEAQQRVDSLKQQGIQSEVRAEISKSGRLSDRYLVIVPGSPADLPGLTQQAMRLGVRSESIQPRDRPLGSHLELGAFVNRAEAEAMSRSLRIGGLDARVYFNR